MVTLDQQYLSLVAGVVLPAIVAFVTKQHASSQVKAAALGLLAVLSGTLTQIIQAGGSFDLKKTLIAIAVTYVSAQTGYSAILKPFGVTAAIASKTSDKGLGTNEPTVVNVDVVKADTVVADDVVETGDTGSGDTVEPVEEAGSDDTGDAFGEDVEPAEGTVEEPAAQALVAPLQVAPKKRAPRKRAPKPVVTEVVEEVPAEVPVTKAVKKSPTRSKKAPS